MNIQKFLEQRFLESAEVIDFEKGYIKAVEFTLALDPDILDLASKVWAERYKHLAGIDAIVGLPDAGSRLVSIVADKLRIPRILPSKRVAVAPNAWEDVVSYSNTSFTRDEELLSQIGFVKSGQKILLVDDVIAHGTTAIAAISALQAHGVEVAGLLALFDKVWQNGTAAIEEKTGVKVFSIIRVKNLNADGSIDLL